MRHAIRIAVIWVAVSVILEILVAILPIPAPNNSPEGSGEHQTIYMLFYVGAPIVAFVWTVFLYSIIAFKWRPGEEVERTSPPESTPVLLLWAGISFVIVLFLAGWGTFTLHEITQAPHPAVVYARTIVHGQTKLVAISKPAKTLDIQVIGQQWTWTFRYPSYGGMETRDLIVPVNTPILLHVTSLDVVHSLWIYSYDVKMDAVPGVENTVWFLAYNTSSYSLDGTNWVKCNELCGLRHGYMKTGLYVKTRSAFGSWARRQFQFEKAVGLLNVLPKYAPVYYPTSNANWPTAPQDQSP